LNSKPISGGLFGFLIIMFFLPFLTVSCGGDKVASYTGVQLVTGTNMADQEIKPSGILILALVIAVAGLALSFSDNWLVCAIAGLLNVILLYSFKMSGDQQLSKATIEAGIPITATYEAGFWLALLAGCAVACFNGYLFWQDHNYQTYTGHSGGSKDSS
jgi:hypothetical protein